MREGEEPSHGHYAEHATALVKGLRRLQVKIYRDISRQTYYQATPGTWRGVKYFLRRNLGKQPENRAHLGKHIAYRLDPENRRFSLHPEDVHGLDHNRAIERKMRGED